MKNKQPIASTRRAKVSAPVYLSAPSVSAAAETDGGGPFFAPAEDPEEAFTMRTFLPDEFESAVETEDVVREPEKERVELKAEKLDETPPDAIINRSFDDPIDGSESSKQFTTYVGQIEDSIGVTENLDEAFAEKAFLSDEPISPHEVEGSPPEQVPDAPMVEIFVDASPDDSVGDGAAGGIVSESTASSLTEFWGRGRPRPLLDAMEAGEDARAPEKLRLTEADPTVDDAVKDNINFIPVFEPVLEPPPDSGVETPPTEVPENAPSEVAADRPLEITATGSDSTPKDIFHDEIVAELQKSVEQSITAPVAPLEVPIPATQSSSPEYFQTEVIASTEVEMAPNVVVNEQPAEPVAVAPLAQPVAEQPTQPAAGLQSSEPVPAPETITVFAEPERYITPAPPIRYLRPIAGSLVVKPAPVVQVEIADYTELDPEPELSPSPVTSGGGWTIPLMCLGIGLIACCMIIPQANMNRRLYHERQALQADLDSIQKQVAVNDEFLKEVIDNPTLAERLASRQMKTLRKGQRVLAVKQIHDDGDMSPFALVNVPRPRAREPYRPVIGTIADLCNNSRSRLYLLGTAMTMVAAGLVLGFSPKVK